MEKEIKEQLNEVKRNSEVINDSLWYVNPKDIEKALEETYEEGREKERDICVGERKWCGN